MSWKASENAPSWWALVGRDCSILQNDVAQGKFVGYSSISSTLLSDRSTDLCNTSSRWSSWVRDALGRFLGALARFWVAKDFWMTKKQAVTDFRGWEQLCISKFGPTWNFKWNGILCMWISIDITYYNRSDQKFDLDVDCTSCYRCGLYVFSYMHSMWLANKIQILRDYLTALLLEVHIIQIFNIFF